MNNILKNFCLGFFILIFSNLETFAEIHPSPYFLSQNIFTVPLEIKDNSGVSRESWPVSSGVPLPFGIVNDVNGLRLTDTEGKEIPCHFTVLSRYWAKDNSIRWVLLDFQIDIPANGKRTVILNNDKPAGTLTTFIKNELSADSIKISTGNLDAIITRTRGNIFDSVSINGKQLIKAQTEDGPSLVSGKTELMEYFKGIQWNNAGWHKYASMEDTHIEEALYKGRPNQYKDVTIELNGPMRSVVVIRGKYLPASDKRGTIRNGIYNYTTRLHFYRGKSFIRVEHAIENSDPNQPFHNYLYRSAGISHSHSLGKNITVTGGGNLKHGPLPAHASSKIKHKQSALLYQTAGSHKKKHGRVKAYPGNYSLYIGQNIDSSNKLAEGKHARFLDVSDAEKGIAIAMRYMWEHAPRAISASTGKITVAFHADNPGPDISGSQKRPQYDLDFGERSINDVLFYFHEGDATTAHSREIAEAFESPLFARAHPSWYAKTNNWYFEISKNPAKLPRKHAGDQHWSPTPIGYRKHGINRSYNSGGHHESLNSAWLPFLRTGALSELERNLAQSRWSIAHNPGWAYKNNIPSFGHKSNKLTKLDQFIEHWNRLTGYAGKEFYLWRSKETVTVKTRKGEVTKHKGGSTYLNKYKWLPDHEHYALFRLFEYYYLTGDKWALDAIYGFVNWGINFQHRKLFNNKLLPLDDFDYFVRDPDALRRGHYSRVYSWMLYTTLAGFHATGNEVYDYFSRWQIRRLLALLRHRHGQPTNWRKRLKSPNLFSKGESVYQSRAQSWMDAQVALSLHDAYKTYNDERILDGLWGLADYFSNHVIYFPKLGMLNNRTSMPNQLLGYGTGKSQSLTPLHHDRYIQALPILYYYTGWDALRKRYTGLSQSKHRKNTKDWFRQTGYWVAENKTFTNNKAPERITDLKVVDLSRNGIKLSWTSPKDDGPSGKASTYFIKYSDKPIVDFAPTDNPERKKSMEKIINAAETLLLKRSKNKKIQHKHLKFKSGDLPQEPKNIQRWHPDWHKKVAFWMAEHVVGEPAPATAGKRESFIITKLKPHNWFGVDKNPTVADLKPGKYYIAICSWDGKFNLSRVSNVVSVDLR